MYVWNFILTDDFFNSIKQIFINISFGCIRFNPRSSHTKDSKKNGS